MRIIQWIIHCPCKNVRAAEDDNRNRDLENATIWFTQNGMKDR